MVHQILLLVMQHLSFLRIYEGQCIVKYWDINLKNMCFRISYDTSYIYVFNRPVVLQEIQFSFDVNHSVLLPECLHYVKTALRRSLVFFTHMDKLPSICFRILGAIFSYMENQIHPLTRMLLLVLRQVWIKVQLQKLTRYLVAFLNLMNKTGLFQNLI